MAFRECANASYFTGVAPFNPVPIGTILDLTGSIVNATKATGVPLPLLGAGYTLPAGVWSIDAGCLAQIDAVSGQTTQYVNTNFDIVYNGVTLATTDWGNQTAGAGTADLDFDIYKQHFVSGAVASTGGAGLFNVVLTSDTAGGQSYTLDATPSLASNNFIRAVRIA